MTAGANQSGRSVRARRAPWQGAGKVVVVTGGGGGIGAAVAQQVAARGATVVIVDLRASAANTVRAMLGDGDHQILTGDLTQRQEVERILSVIESRHGRIDVLINSMGMTSAERFDERSVDSIDWELTVNLHAPLMMTRLAIPLLHAAPDPRVITVVSLGAIFPLGETPIYTASKYGLRGAMLSIALDLRDKGIAVSSVLPSATDTRMLQQEALDGGNAFQFQDPPQTPEHVASTMVRLLDRPRLEAYPKPSESWLVRAALLAPNLLPRVMPLFRGKGERGQAKYIAQLHERGLIDSSGKLRDRSS
ncbi:SDR family oxidoreductase [Demequina sp. B12]|uniref:SDR family NAD(P)-dependent oxidoreductase n=1 Tax=Demequina sp. B12 TaxID=2992757 RepID=UPI00237C30B5|nr:SDR family oxidoreductase [Demequina sp. B12]MDE0573479.1 SDR family oxidoreductase [Demequina sp. B12]